MLAADFVPLEQRLQGMDPYEAWGLCLDTLCTGSCSHKSAESLIQAANAIQQSGDVLLDGAVLRVFNLLSRALETTAGCRAQNALLSPEALPRAVEDRV